jgi:hypothetical protein
MKEKGERVEEGAQKYIIQRQTKFIRNQVGLIEQNFRLMQELAEKDVSLRDAVGFIDDMMNFTSAIEHSLDTINDTLDDS